MTRAVIFDIDGTLADCSHRLYHVTGSSKNWPAFFASMDQDGCVEKMRDLAIMVHGSDMAILLCSGRPETHRAVTEQWMARNSVPYAALYMRPENDHRPDHVVKSQILDGIIADGYDIQFVVDDRDSVVRMWRERGLICLQCREWGDDKKSAASGPLTLMVGPSGAGKTSWLSNGHAKEYGIHPSHVISSDQIRQDLCGDFRDQTRNGEVFAALHAQAKVRVAYGLPTVIDATNLRRKDRLEAAAIAGSGKVRYIVIDRPMEQKRRDGGWRNELPIDLFEKHAQTFRSQIKDILHGDGLPNVEVIDLRVA